MLAIKGRGTGVDRTRPARLCCRSVADGNPDWPTAPYLRLAYLTWFQIGHLTCGASVIGVPRDPVAPVVKAVEDLAKATAAIGHAQVQARQLVADARQREKTARAVLHDRIVEAAKVGVRQVDLVRASGLTREAVRRIVRAGGVEAD